MIVLRSHLSLHIIHVPISGGEQKRIMSYYLRTLSKCSIEFMKIFTSVSKKNSNSSFEPIELICIENCNLCVHYAGHSMCFIALVVPDSSLLLWMACAQFHTHTDSMFRAHIQWFTITLNERNSTMKRHIIKSYRWKC